MIKTLDFQKQNGLIPAIIQNDETLEVLMLGYMNPQAYQKTKETGFVHFYSRSRQKLWLKGETSGHKLAVVSIEADCDADTLLIRVHPMGPTCHTGNVSCFHSTYKNPHGWLPQLEHIIEEHKSLSPDKSYVARLFQVKGAHKIAQKVGEEAVETVIEAIAHNNQLFQEEAADLVFHLLILLNERGFRLKDICNVLEKRHHS